MIEEIKSCKLRTSFYAFLVSVNNGGYYSLVKCYVPSGQARDVRKGRLAQLPWVYLEASPRDAAAEKIRIIKVTDPDELANLTGKLRSHQQRTKRRFSLLETGIA